MSSASSVEPKRDRARWPRAGPPALRRMIWPVIWPIPVVLHGADIKMVASIAVGLKRKMIGRANFHGSALMPMAIKSSSVKPTPFSASGMARIRPGHQPHVRKITCTAVRAGGLMTSITRWRLTRTEDSGTAHMAQAAPEGAERCSLPVDQIGEVARYRRMRRMPVHKHVVDGPDPDLNRGEVLESWRLQPVAQQALIDLGRQLEPEAVFIGGLPHPPSSEGIDDLRATSAPVRLTRMHSQPPSVSDAGT